MSDGVIRSSLVAISIIIIMSINIMSICFRLAWLTSCEISLSQLTYMKLAKFGYSVLLQSNYMYMYMYMYIRQPNNFMHTCNNYYHLTTYRICYLCD